MRTLVGILIIFFAFNAHAKLANSKANEKSEDRVETKFGSTSVKRAVTDEGNVVILNADGTWQYENSNQAEAASLALTENNKPFTKSADLTFLLKSTKNKTAFWINPAKWSFQKGAGETQQEYQFLLKGNDLYGAAITEQIEISMDALGQIALNNARKLAPDMQIVQQELRTVNGIKVLYMQMNGSAKGAKFTFMGYYYSDKNGSTQFVTWTASNLVEKYKPEIETFLNGFTIQQ